MHITPESAFYALDGPREQVIDKLTTVIFEAELSNEPWAAALAAEARDYLAEISA
jgi:hypothetical protein